MSIYDWIAIGALAIVFGVLMGAEATHYPKDDKDNKSK